MNQLINIENISGIQLVDAKHLHGKLESKRDFHTWFSQRVEKYGFVKNEDYFAENQILSQIGGKIGRGRPEINYILTIGMAKELAMVQDNEIGRKIRKYFISVEKQSQQLILKVPKPIMVEGTHECLQYDFWLLQNGYSVSSGQFHRRIKKHPRNFYKGGNGKWYISREYANALLEFKECGKKLTDCVALPTWEQTSLFN